MTNEHPKAVQDILNKLQELIDAVKERQQLPAVQDSKNREPVLSLLDNTPLQVRVRAP